MSKLQQRSFSGTKNFQILCRETLQMIRGRNYCPKNCTSNFLAGHAQRISLPILVKFPESDCIYHHFPIDFEPNRAPLIDSKLIGKYYT